jgi:Fe2+ transport system protein B
VVDATRLERNLNLVLQVLEITDRVVVCLNLIDEAERHGLQVDERRLARDLGVPVVPTVARSKKGLDLLLKTIHEIATGQTIGKPHRLQSEPPELKKAINILVEQLNEIYPGLPNSRWVALRLLDGDESLIQAVQNGDLAGLATDPDQAPALSGKLELEASP